MNKEYKDLYEKKLAYLSDRERILRDLYLRKLALGEYQGPNIGYPSIDKPWLKYYSEDAIDIEIPKMCAYDYIRKCSEGKKDSIAINYYGNKITYGELEDKKVFEAFVAFKKMGIKRGDCVTFCMPTIPETIYSFFALNLIGATCNFIDLRMNKERILKYTNDTNSKIIISLNSVSEKVYEILHDSTATTLINVDAGDSLKPSLKMLYNLKNKDKFKCDKYDTISWNHFIKDGKSITKEEIERYRLDYNKVLEGDDFVDFPAGIVYTGGTTGEPKGAILTNRNIVAPCYQYRYADIPRGYNDKFVNIMPPFIAYGLVNGIMLPLSVNMECLLFPKFNPEEFSQILKKYRPEHFVGIPLHYEKLMADKRCDGLNLSFIKNAGCGGDSIPESLEKEYNQFAKDHNCPNKMRDGLGMTEHAAMSIYDLNNEMTKEGRTGIPMQKMKIGVFDEKGNELGYNEEGELWITSPAVFLGYNNNQKETDNIIKVINGERWLKTGDNVSIDEDGNVKIIGRKKSMIVRPDGHNVWPNMIRDKLFSCPIIKDLCVVGIKSKKDEIGVIPTAIVVLKDNTMDKEEAKRQILEYQSHLLGERDGVSDVRFRTSLLYTPIGKIDYVKITEEENKNMSDLDSSVLMNNSKKKVLK